MDANFPGTARGVSPPAQPQLRLFSVEASKFRFRDKPPVQDESQESGIETAIEVSSRFKPREARTILGEVFKAVGLWRDAGKQLRLNASTLDSYSSAFDNPGE